MDIMSINNMTISNTALQQIAQLLNCQPQDIVGKSIQLHVKYTEDDCLLSKADSIQYWSDFYDKAAPIAKYILNTLPTATVIQSGDTFLDDNYDYYVSCIKFFLDKSDFINCQIDAQWCPMTGDLPYFLYHATTDNEELNAALRQLDQLIYNCDMQITKFTNDAISAGKAFGLYEKCQLND